MNPLPNESPRKKFFVRYRWELIIIGIVITIFGGSFLLVYGSILVDEIKEHRSRIPFDSNTWKASLSRPNDTIRLRMVDDLLRSRKLIGMSRNELVALLGTPPTAAARRDYDLIYWLGPQRGYMGLDSELLGVRFGPDQRVAEARIIGD